MFKDTISTNTAFTSQQANAVLSSKINGRPILDDYSFIATLRALLIDKIGDETVTVGFRNGLDNGVCIDYILEDDFYNTNRIMVYGTYRNFNLEDFIDRLPSKVTSYCENHDRNLNLREIERVRQLFQKNFKIAAFVDDVGRNVFIIIPEITVKKLHYMQCTTIGLLPWYFDPSEPVSEGNMQLMFSLSKSDSTEYIQCLNKMAEKYDFKTEWIKSALSGFETKYEQLQLKQILNAINEDNEFIDDLMRQIANRSKRIRDNQIMYTGLEQKIKQGSEKSEIMEYFMSNKSIDLVDSNDCRLTYAVRGYLEFFSPQEAESYINSKSSVMYRYATDENIDKMKKLYEALFIDRTLKIKMCACYKIDIQRMTVDPCGGYVFGPEYINTLPNPHIDQYNCLGDYREIISELFRRFDYISIIEQTVVSCSSLSFIDTVVMSTFIDEIWGCRPIRATVNGDRCIELPDGKMVTASEAMEWVNKEA